MKGLISLLVPLLIVSPGPAQQRAGTIAEVNGEVITRLDLRRLLRGHMEYQEILRSYSGEALRRRAAGIEREVLEILVQKKLLQQEIRKKGLTIDAADEAEVDRIHRLSISRFGSEEEYRKALEMSGLTVEDEKKEIRFKVLVDKLRRQALGPEPFVTPAEIRTFYQERSEEISERGALDDDLVHFCIKGSLKVRQIRLPGSTEEAAREIREAVLGGADFADLARDHEMSNGPRKEEGGLWVFEGTEASFTTKRADAVRDLQPGGISPVIQDRGYLYILKLESREPTRMKPFDEIREDVRRIMARRKRQVQQDEWFGGLLKKAHIRYYGADGRSG